MTIYKSAADEIAEAMIEALEKEAARWPVSWEAFKKVVDSATKCEDLKTPQSWIEQGRCAMFQDRAIAYLGKKRTELC